MELRDILALRLRALIDQRPDLDTQTKIHKRAVHLGYRLSQSSIQRILACEVHTSLDIVEMLGLVYGVSPLDLLTPIKADDEHGIAPSYEEKQLLLAWRKISDEDQHKAMAFMSVAAQTRKKGDDKASRQIDIDQSQQVPAPLVAANKKAMGKGPESESRVTVTHAKSRSSAAKKSR